MSNYILQGLANTENNSLYTKIIVICFYVGKILIQNISDVE